MSKPLDIIFFAISIFSASRVLGNQSYTASGDIFVKPGEETTETKTKTVSVGGNFNIFTMEASVNASTTKSRHKTVDYHASQFESKGTNVFRAGRDIAIVIPQITGTRNVFDAMIVSLENKANEEKMESHSRGFTLSSNLAKSVAGTLGANFGASDSRDTALNDAYIRGAVDFMHSKVRNNGCLAMKITNKGSSYKYVPADEVHESSSWAIGLSGLDLGSADAFAYSLARSVASAGASAAVGYLSSEAGLGGFASTLAASLAGSYVANSMDAQLAPPEAKRTNTESKLPSISTASTVSFDHNGNGFRAVSVSMDGRDLGEVIHAIKSQIFDDALDANAPVEEVVEVIQREVEEVTRDIVEFQQEAKQVEKLAKKVASETSVARNFEISDSMIDMLFSPNEREETLMDQHIHSCLLDIALSNLQVNPRDQMRMYEPKNNAELALKKATLLRYKLEDFVAKHPEAAELCSKMFVGAVYALQGIEYAVAGVAAGPFGIAAKFAAQESAAFALETTIDATSSRAAKLITQCETLQQEFQNTIKLCAYAGMCAGSVKASKRFVGAIAKNAKNLGRSGKQARLREIMHDDKVGSCWKGWLKQEDNAMKRNKAARPGLLGCRQVLS